MKVKDILNILLKNSYYEKELLINQNISDEQWFNVQREYEQWLESEVGNDM